VGCTVREHDLGSYPPSWRDRQGKQQAVFTRWLAVDLGDELRPTDDADLDER